MKPVKKAKKNPARVVTLELEPVSKKKPVKKAKVPTRKDALKKIMFALSTIVDEIENLVWETEKEEDDA